MRKAKQQEHEALPGTSDGAISSATPANPNQTPQAADDQAEFDSLTFQDAEAALDMMHDPLLASLGIPTRFDHKNSATELRRVALEIQEKISAREKRRQSGVPPTDEDVHYILAQAEGFASTLLHTITTAIDDRIRQLPSNSKLRPDWLTIQQETKAGILSAVEVLNQKMMTTRSWLLLEEWLGEFKSSITEAEGRYAQQSRKLIKIQSLTFRVKHSNSDDSPEGEPIDTDAFYDELEVEGDPYGEQHSLPLDPLLSSAGWSSFRGCFVSREAWEDRYEQDWQHLLDRTERRNAGLPLQPSDRDYYLSFADRHMKQILYQLKVQPLQAPENDEEMSLHEAKFQKLKQEKRKLIIEAFKILHSNVETAVTWTIMEEYLRDFKLSVDQIMAVQEIRILKIKGQRGNSIQPNQQTRLNPCVNCDELLEGEEYGTAYFAKLFRAKNDAVRHHVREFLERPVEKKTYCNNRNIDENEISQSHYRFEGAQARRLCRHLDKQLRLQSRNKTDS